MKDINTDLMRLDNDIRVLDLKTPEKPFQGIEDLLEVTYIKDGVQSILYGTLLGREDHADYELRHAWTMDIAEALVVAH